MTSIIYDGKVLLTDSAMTDGSRFCGSAKKIHHLKDGRVVAMSGCFESTTQAVNWLENGGEKPKFDEDKFSLLIIYPDGTHKSMFQNLVAIDEPLPLLQGSGRDFLAGAYDQSKNAYKAMESACKLDVYSSLPMQEYKVNPDPPVAIEKSQTSTDP